MRLLHDHPAPVAVRDEPLEEVDEARRRGAGFTHDPRQERRDRGVGHPLDQGGHDVHRADHRVGGASAIEETVQDALTEVLADLRRPAKHVVELVRLRPGELGRRPQFAQHGRNRPGVVRRVLDGPAKGAARVIQNRAADAGRLQVVADHARELDEVATHLAAQQRAEVNLEDGRAHMAQGFPLALDAPRAARVLWLLRQEGEERAPAVGGVAAVQIQGTDAMPVAEVGDISDGSLGRVDRHAAGEQCLGQDRQAEQAVGRGGTRRGHHVLERRDDGLVRGRIEAHRSGRRAERPRELLNRRLLGKPCGACVSWHRQGQSPGRETGSAASGTVDPGWQTSSHLLIGWNGGKLK